jgi:DNA sulfur modification protein DndC
MARSISLNRSRQLNLFEEQKNPMNIALDLALASFREQATGYERMSVGFSGGKDSTTTVTLLAYFIKTGRLDLNPKDITIFYGDTGRELPPLHDHAMLMLDFLAKEGFKPQIVKPKIDNTFWVRMLGVGIPVPTNFFRWCVGDLKIEPMEKVVKAAFRQSARKALEEYVRQPDTLKRYNRYKPQGIENDKVKFLNRHGSKLLMITGYRKGESLTRDLKIETICSTNGECGTGMWQPQAVEYDRLAPLVNWGTCNIFDWLNNLLTEEDGYEPHWYPTKAVARIYGDQDIRTGCAGCSVASKDTALERIVRFLPEFAYLAPLLKLRILWELVWSKREFRLHQDGTANSRATDLGPLTIEARKFMYRFIQGIQKEIYELGGHYQIISLEERERIFWHWENNSWPQGWDGSQPVGNFQQLIPAGQSELLLFGA